MVVRGEPHQPGPQQRALAQVERPAHSLASDRGDLGLALRARGSADRSSHAAAAPARAGAMSWTPSPVARCRTWCAATRAGRRASVRACSQGGWCPAGRAAAGAAAVTYSVLPGSSWSRNHSRCWANDSGSAAVVAAATGMAGSAGQACRVAASGISAGQPGDGGAGEDGARGQLRRRRPARSRETIWMARMESPPRSKKLSWMPTWSMPRTSAQMPAMACSAGVRGRGVAGRRRRRRVGGGQGAAVELAVGGQRQRVQGGEGGGDHVVGQRGRPGARAARRRRARRRRGRGRRRRPGACGPGCPRGR